MEMREIRFWLIYDWMRLERTFCDPRMCVNLHVGFSPNRIAAVFVERCVDVSPFLTFDGLMKTHQEIAFLLVIH